MPDYEVTLHEIYEKTYRVLNAEGPAEAIADAKEALGPYVTEISSEFYEFSIMHEPEAKPFQEDLPDEL